GGDDGDVLGVSIAGDDDHDDLRVSVASGDDDAGPGGRYTSVANTSATASSFGSSGISLSTFHHADSTAPANAQAVTRQRSSPARSVMMSMRRRVTRGKSGQVNTCGDGLRSHAPTSKAGSPTTPCGSITSHGARCAARML